MACSVNFGSAWKNGVLRKQGEGDSTYARTPYDYAMDYQFSLGTKYYATHDWIAESALQLLYEKTGNDFITKIYLNTEPWYLKWWFLLGTEVPDSPQAYSVTLITRCDNTVTNRDYGNAWGSHQYITFGQDSPNTIGTPAMYRNIDKAKMGVTQSFTQKDCQKAAYFLGALVHIISDAAFYPHIYGSSHRTFGARMAWLTNNILRTPADFFSIQEARTAFTAGTMLGGRVAAYRMALDTKYGNAYYSTKPDCAWVCTQYQSAMWLEDQLNNVDVWPKQSGLSYYNSWSQVERFAITLNGGTPKLYFDTVEHHLNTAVYYSAAVVNKLLVNYQNCDCDGENGEDGRYNGGGFNGQDTIDKISDKENVELEIVAVMGVTGIFFTLLALRIVKKLNELASLRKIKVPGLP